MYIYSNPLKTCAPSVVYPRFYFGAGGYVPSGLDKGGGIILVFKEAFLDFLRAFIPWCPHDCQYRNPKGISLNHQGPISGWSGGGGGKETLGPGAHPQKAFEISAVRMYVVSVKVTKRPYGNIFNSPCTVLIWHSLILTLWLFTG